MKRYLKLWFFFSVLLINFKIFLMREDLMSIVMDSIIIGMALTVIIEDLIKAIRGEEE